jgi:hypothetical protein
MFHSTETQLVEDHKKTFDAPVGQLLCHNNVLVTHHLPHFKLFLKITKEGLFGERGGVGKCVKAVEVSVLYISYCECSKLGYVHICQ